MNSFGWFGAINPSVSSCGGVLLTRDWLLTARHCAPLSGIVGFCDGHGQLAGPEADIVLRRQLEGPIESNDLALLKLSWREDNVPAAIDWQRPPDITFDKFQLVGWGRGGQLRCVDLTLLDQPATVEAYYQVWGDRAGAPSDRLLGTRGAARGALKGDSGGPLLGIAAGTAYLLGVLSAGDLRGTDLFCSFDANRAWVADTVGVNDSRLS